MSGYWWLAAKGYLKDRLPPRWVNKDACVRADAAARFADDYTGVDRALSLAAPPHFDFDHREKKPRAMTPIMQTLLFERLGPAFLMSREFAELVSGFDPGGLVQAACGVTRHGKAVDGFVFADVAHVFDGRDVFDRAQSHVSYQVGFAHDDGRRTHAFDVNGPVRFKADRIGAHDIFWVQLGWQGARIAVSDRLADAVFARPLMGLMIEDATGRRSAPVRYGRYAFDGWEDLHPG